MFVTAETMLSCSGVSLKSTTPSLQFADSLAVMATTIEGGSLDFREFVRPNDMVVWGQGCGEPRSLTESLMAQRHAIGRFKVFTGLCYSDTPDPHFTDAVEFVSYHGGGSNQRLGGKLDILPCHYFQLPRLLRDRCDVLLLQISAANDAGNHSLGLSHDYIVPLIDSARIVIAEVNDQIPWLAGERTINAIDVDVLVHTSRPPLEIPSRASDAVDRAIAARAAALIDDGATLQIGIGALPAAILAALSDHRRLGVHSGSLFDPIVDLLQSGTIDNSSKGVDDGVTVAGMLLGTRKLFAFADHNRQIQMRSALYTHDSEVLGRLNRFVALNSAIEVDLTGQVNAELADGRYIGAVGGAVDFIRGAQRSRGGLAITALRSRAAGKAKIVAQLTGPVSTSRADTGIVVTEHGVADLRGQPLKERIKKMIAIAHPDDRDALARHQAISSISAMS
jgi:acyl-CoA hydrolase